MQPSYSNPALIFPRLQQLDRKLPLLMSLVVLATVGFFAWAGYSKFSESLYLISGNRLASAAGLVSNLVAQSVPRWQTQVGDVAKDPAVITFLTSGTGRADAVAAIERSNPTAARGRWRAQIIDSRGRTVVDRTWRTAMSWPEWVDRRVRDGPSGTGMAVSPIMQVEGIPVYQILVPVFAEGADNRRGARPLGYVADTRAMVEGTQGALRDLIGDSVTMVIGQHDAGIWTDLEKVKPAPPRTPSEGTPTTFDRSSYGPGIGVSRSIPGTTWTIWLHQQRDLILAPVDAFVLQTVPIGAAIALIGALLGWLVSHGIAHRIVALTEQAERVFPEDANVDRAMDRPRDEVERLSEAFNRMSRRVAAHQELEGKLRQAQKLEAIGRLAGGIAHDFNNILTVIRNYTEFVRDELPKNSALAPDIDQVLTATDRAASLTGQLLAFSRNQVVTPKLIDLNSVVRKAEGMLRRVVPTNIELVTELDDELGTVMGDIGHMDQILLNLSINAADAMPDGGTLSIRTQRARLDESFSLKDIPVKPGRYASIIVTDSGTGIDRDTMVRIFDPFFTTKDVGKGTGLGLATVHGIVTQSGGHIRVYSELGHGATFKVYLPEASGEVSESYEIAALRDDRKVNETILLAEDDDQTREVTRRILVKRGYTVLEARDGNEALQIAGGHAGPIHLVLSDMMMPGLKGGELAEGLRAVRPHAPFLLMSGYNGPEIARRSLLNEALTFIEKPFTQESLLTLVRQSIDSTGIRSVA